MPTSASSFGAMACGIATESPLSALLEIKLRLLPELDAVCDPESAVIRPFQFRLLQCRLRRHRRSKPAQAPGSEARCAGVSGTEILSIKILDIRRRRNSERCASSGRP